MQSCDGVPDLTGSWRSHLNVPLAIPFDLPTLPSHFIVPLYCPTSPYHLIVPGHCPSLTMSLLTIALKRPTALSHLTASLDCLAPKNLTIPLLISHYNWSSESFSTWLLIFSSAASDGFSRRVTVSLEGLSSTTRLVSLLKSIIDLAESPEPVNKSI